jgi:hypothetical protein
MADIFERNGARPASEPGRKLGQGHFGAMARLGMKELRNAANPSPQSVADSEMGLFGTAGPMEAAQQQGVTPANGSQPQHDPVQQTQQPDRSR